MVARAQEQSFESILMGAQQGDVDAITAIYKKYNRLVWVLAADVQRLSVKSRYIEPADVVQEVFMSLFVKNKISAFQVERSSYTEKSFKNWICTFTVNWIRDHSRGKENNNVYYQQSDDVDTASNGGDINMLEYSDEYLSWEGFQELIDGLTEAQKTVLTLRYYHDLKFDDIAHFLNIKPETARSRADSALKAIRRRREDIGQLE